MVTSPPANGQLSNGTLPQVSNLTDLYLMGLWPMQGPWPGGIGILPASLMALEHINANPNILPGYRLNMIWNDTKVRKDI